MSQPIEIYWTSGSIDEARKVCRYLAQERLVACAQIIPWLESIYMWNGQLETAQESKVSLKTDLKHFDAIKQLIQENTSYELPEITYKHIDGGDLQYMEWLMAQTAS